MKFISSVVVCLSLSPFAHASSPPKPDAETIYIGGNFVTVTDSAPTSEALAVKNGRSYRLFNVIDDFKREGLAIEAGFSLPTMRVIRTLNQLLEGRTKPIAIRCDNGPEFISHEFTEWAKKHEIRIDYIQPGKPQQNAYIERHNKTIRYSWVSKHLFDTLEEVQDYATKWLWFYNHERPHKANGGKPPLMVA